MSLTKISTLKVKLCGTTQCHDSFCKAKKCCRLHGAVTEAPHNVREGKSRVQTVQRVHAQKK